MVAINNPIFSAATTAEFVSNYKIQLLSHFTKALLTILRLSFNLESKYIQTAIHLSEHVVLCQF